MPSSARPQNKALMPEVSASVSSVRLPMPIRMRAAGCRRRSLHVAHEGSREAEMDGIQDGIENEGFCRPCPRLGGAAQGVEIAGPAGMRMGRRHFLGEVERVLAEAEEKSAPAPPPAATPPHRRNRR